MSLTKRQRIESFSMWASIYLPLGIAVGFAIYYPQSNLHDRETSLFISLLENKDESMRVAAIGELCKPEHRSNSVLGLMYDKLADGSSREKQAVILGLYDYPPARQYIAEAADDSDTEVREIANAALAGDFQKK